MNAISSTMMNNRSMTTDSLGGLMSHACDPTSATVPLKPSATMLAAGARAGGVSVEAAWKIYQAMIKMEE